MRLVFSQEPLFGLAIFRFVVATQGLHDQDLTVNGDTDLLCYANMKGSDSVFIAKLVVYGLSGAIK